ncbi:amidase [Pseudomonas chlororaphis]|uniref:Amidase n=1 Tax=Pseudomonas chlororaphis TaxID=587753 RepID=A0AAP9VTR9_9PSED|nr:amidase family protein [Pseudomonas chlororaphis]AUG42947.1 amidase [Pseudomonas chlororaphis]QNR46794.1 amidase [Pseudomonas chlororaphis]
MSFSEYATFDAVGLADLVRTRQVRPSELLEEAIRRIEAFNPAVNAVVYKAYDKARAQAAEQDKAPATGALHGVPFLLKDILGDCQDLPSTLASRMLQARVMPQDCELVKRFRQAGLVFVGKTNAPEFGILPTTEGAFYGPARNPWNLEYSTGGSSGGAAAAVATGMVPAAHGNDGGGSIRIPASCCGLVGLKPTRARNSLAPDFGELLSGLLDEHVLTRSVRDSAALLDATHGVVPGDPYRAPPMQGRLLDQLGREPGRLRIAFSSTDPAGRPLHPDCIAAVESTARLLESLGHHVEEAAPQLDLQSFAEAFSALWFSGIAFAVELMSLQLGRGPLPGELENLTQAVHQRGLGVSAVEYQMSELVLQQVGREMARFHQTYDCWLTPTLARPPLRNGVVDIHSSDLENTYGPLIDYSPFTAIHNASGQPAISLPLHWNAEGLPIGLMLSAAFGEEGLLFRLAGQLEQARPWKDRRPQLFMQHRPNEAVIG